jgi:hypothetical protein
MTTTDRTTASWAGSPAGPVTDGPRPTTMAAAALSVGVGSVHVALAPEHLAHWWVFGAFFLVVGLFQLGYAGAVLWRPNWQIALVGIVVNTAIVLTYVASRTVGLPVSPPPEDVEAGGGHSEGGEGAGRFTEAVGVLDLATAAAELALIGVLVSLLPRRLRTSTCNVLLLIGVALWALRVSGSLS